MSRRNFTLLIIVLAIIVGAVFWFLSSRQILTTGGNGEGINFLARFNPFGKKSTPPDTTTPDGSVNGGLVVETPEIKLRKISNIPIAGFAVFQKERFKEVAAITPLATPPTETTPPKTPPKPTPPPTEFVPALRYVDRATGNIYQTFADKIDERKFSTTLIPRVYEAYFGNKGGSILMRYLKTNSEIIETFFGLLPKEPLGEDIALDTAVQGSFLPTNIKDLSLSPDTLKIFYLFNIGTNEDSAVGITFDLLGNKKVQVFDSPFTEWLSFWPNAGVITLTTKPAAGVPGYMYIVDPNKKSFSKALGAVNGLTTRTSPSGKLVLYGNDNLILNIYHLDTKTADPLGIRTLPEKCVWAKTSAIIYCAVPKTIPGVAYPDTWYQGGISFADAIWKIDIENERVTMILDPASMLGGETIDGIKLALDENESYLFFVNKKDSSLWELQLK